MNKLLSANFSRLWKSRVFWLMEGICAVTGAVLYVLAIINTRNNGMNWYLSNGNYYFFLESVYIGAVMAIFSSFYIGTEYSDGTIRNKLSVGHSHKNIYFADLIVTVTVGVLCMAAHILASVCIGLPFFGKMFWEALAPAGWRILSGLIMILCYGTIFTFLAILDNNKARNVIVSFILALLIVLGGLFTYIQLLEPEFSSRMVMQEDGSYQLEEGIPNSRYVGGTIRHIYSVADACIPSSQAYNIVRYEGEFQPLSVVCLLVSSVTFTIAGIVVFQKKDIK